MKLSTRSVTLAAVMGALLVGCGSDSDDHKPMPEPEPQNTAPQATSANFVTQADVALMDNLSGTDADGDALTFAVQTQPANGELVLESDGSFTYTPPAASTGTASFSFVVSDGMKDSAPAEVQIVIEAQMLSFSAYSRDVYNQDATAEPLPLNGRVLEDDVESPNAYDDLLQSAD